MRAAFYDGNKTVRIGECGARAPGPDEARLEVAYCGICGTDLHIFAGHMDRRVAMPHVMGHEMSGVVAEVGANVTEWQTGDRVAVRPLDPCGACPACHAGHSHICQNLKFLGIDTPGAFQNSWTVPAHTLHRLPDGVSLERGALIEPLAVACHDVRMAGVRPDEFAVVIGGGPIGVLIALVARQAGARVVISEVSSPRVEFAHELGLEAVNPTEIDLTAFVNEQTDGAGADVVFEVSASAAGASTMTELPRTRGRIVVVGIFGEAPKVDLFRFFWRELRLIGARVYEPQDYERAIALAADSATPLDRMIAAKRSLSDAPDVFHELAADALGMKTLIEIGAQP
jgi:2-desacetyl-2-hydroxyethyl bacteriochlorophyllide A dehydrogenase